jgi:hypothetical protein
MYNFLGVMIPTLLYLLAQIHINFLLVHPYPLGHTRCIVAYASSVKECLNICLIKLHVKFFVTLLCLVLEIVPNHRGRWLSMNQLSSHEYLRMHFISIYRYWTLEDAY